MCFNKIHLRKMNTILDLLDNRKFVLIAEIGVNYFDIAKKYGITNMEAAKLMIDKAKESGVTAVKFQSYKSNTLAAKESPAYWDLNEESTSSQYELFSKFDAFGEEEYRELATYCLNKEIEFLSTPFDIESADYLYDMMSMYKISSSDLNNYPFVTYIAKKRKPIILSVGASDEHEISNTIKWIREYNDKEIILMHCVLEYPTPYEHANLNKISTLKQKYPDLYIGYSDHTRPDSKFDIIKTAYNLGAQVIEKHFTLDKTLKGNDHYHAMDAKDAKEIMESIEIIDSIRGSGEICCLQSEMTAKKNARRSIVANCFIPKGTLLKKEMLTFKRPASGIPVDKYLEIIGKKTVVDIKEDEIISYEMIER